MKRATKELLIFLLVTYGLVWLLGGFRVLYALEGKGTLPLGGDVMLYPAAGVILGKLILTKDRSGLPMIFFIGFLAAWLIGVLTNVGELGIVILFFAVFLEDREKGNLRAQGLGIKGQNWKLSLRLLLLFLGLNIANTLLANLLIGGPGELLGGLSPSELLMGFAAMPLSFLLFVWSAWGEEYGWRYYLQPLLQKKFGLIKGVLLLGVVWELWHLPFTFVHAASGVLTAEQLFPVFVTRLINTMSLAIFIGYAYMRTQNIWLPVLLHFFFNKLIFLGTRVEVEGTWMTVGLFVLLDAVFFVPFLFTKTFRTPLEEEGCGAVAEKHLPESDQ